MINAYKIKSIAFVFMFSNLLYINQFRGFFSTIFNSENAIMSLIIDESLRSVWIILVLNIIINIVLFKFSTPDIITKKIKV